MDSEAVAPDAKYRPAVSRRRRNLELFATFILALTTIATTWSGFQSALWNGEQSVLYAQAGGKRTESVKADNEAVANRQIDLTLMLGWLEAYTRNDAELTDFYQHRFRAEFQPAFEAWIATNPRSNPDAPSSPFVMPEYQLEAAVRAVALEAEADRLFEEGQRADNFGDDFVLNTVILAVALFFVAISERFQSQSVRFLNLGLAIAILIIGVLRILSLPNIAP